MGSSKPDAYTSVRSDGQTNNLQSEDCIGVVCSVLQNLQKIEACQVIANETVSPDCQDSNISSDYHIVQ